MPKPEFRSCSKRIRWPEHPCPKHNSVLVPRAYGDQSIHAQPRIPFVFQEQATRASMPKPYFRSCSESIRTTILEHEKRTARARARAQNRSKWQSAETLAGVARQADFSHFFRVTPSKKSALQKHYFWREHWQAWDEVHIAGAFRPRPLTLA